MSKKVFISYRREDTGAQAGRLYDRLRQIFPEDDLYFDLNTIGGGENFVESIESAIERSEVVLVLIGKNWLSPRQGSVAPRFGPDDYVSFELSAALRRPILVLPILVDGAQMVQGHLLPSDVRAITTRNALPLRLESFDNDTENIVSTIAGTAAKREQGHGRRTLSSKIGFSLLGLLIASTLLTIGALAHFWVLGRPLSASIGGATTTLLLLVAAILGTLIGFIYGARRRDI